MISRNLIEGIEFGLMGKSAGKEGLIDRFLNRVGKSVGSKVDSVAPFGQFSIPFTNKIYTPLTLKRGGGVRMLSFDTFNPGTVETTRVFIAGREVSPETLKKLKALGLTAAGLTAAGVSASMLS